MKHRKEKQMDHKKELTPELAEKLKAAKTPEELGKILGVDLKAYEKSPLSPDELNAAAGGVAALGGHSIGWENPPDDFTLMGGLNMHSAIVILSSIDTISHDVAISWAKTNWVASNVWDKIKTNGVAWCVDELWGKGYYKELNGYDYFI